MRLILASNYYNHHQASVCRYFSKHVDGEFIFVSTSQMNEERKKLGYQFETPEWVRYIPRTDEGREELQHMSDSFDVMIVGAVPSTMIKGIIKKRRLLVFKYSERPFKIKCNFIKRRLQIAKLKYQNRTRETAYILCASAYTFFDYNQCGLYNSCFYKWGYFPPTKRYTSFADVMEKKKRSEILWCGRLLKWKHPDDAIRVAKLLKDDGYDFCMKFFGNGEMEEQLKDMIEEYGLDDCVYLLGSTAPEQVRINMEQAGTYLFTSDRQEGWGAVLNEAMNSGCAVVASHAIGAVPYLLKNNENGLIYESGNITMLYGKVKNLLDYPEEQIRLGTAAYQTITAEWNAEEAAERFINLAKHILEGEMYPDLYESGPCSKAEMIKDNWFKE